MTADQVEIGSPYSASGSQYWLMSAGQAGIEAARLRVNATGGICGRTLNVALLDDHSMPTRAVNAAAQLAQRPVFALAPVASTQGQAIFSYAGSHQIPAIGSGGFDDREQTSEWAFPAAPRPSTVGRIIAEHALDLGAKRFGIIYESKPYWSTQMAIAAEDAIESAGGVIGASYNVFGDGSVPPALLFKILCRCEAVLVLTSPAGTTEWINAGAPGGRLVTSIAPPGGTHGLAESCSLRCAKATVWRQVEVPDATIEMQRFREDLLAADPQADANDPYVAAAYFQTLLVAEAIGRAGLNPTRDSLRAVLEGETFDAPWTARDLSWAVGKDTNAALLPARFVYSGSSVTVVRAGDWRTISS